VAGQEPKEPHLIISHLSGTHQVGYAERDSLGSLEKEEDFEIAAIKSG
jgi:hypothetical protein